jgi:hypothetical protein
MPQEPIFKNSNPIQSGAKRKTQTTDECEPQKVLKTDTTPPSQYSSQPSIELSAKPSTKKDKTEVDISSIDFQKHLSENTLNKLSVPQMKAFLKEQ